MSPLTEAQQLKLMVDTHGARFDGRIWDVFDEELVPGLPGQPAIADLGCGPGLFLFDVCQKLPESHLYGLDASEVMLDVARNISWPLLEPELTLVHLSETIPLATDSLDVVAMNFFLHQFDYPLPILSECLRVLKPGGFIWIYDWARRPLCEYLDFWEVEPGLPGEFPDRAVAYHLFAGHNRFTQEDWRYLLSTCELAVTYSLPRARGQHLLMLVRRKSEVALGK